MVIGLAGTVDRGRGVRAARGSSIETAEAVIVALAGLGTNDVMKVGMLLLREVMTAMVLILYAAGLLDGVILVGELATVMGMSALAGLGQPVSQAQGVAKQIEDTGCILRVSENRGERTLLSTKNTDTTRTVDLRTVSFPVMETGRGRMRGGIGGLRLGEPAQAIGSTSSMGIGALHIVTIMVLTDSRVMTVLIVFPMIGKVAREVDSATMIVPVATNRGGLSALPLGIGKGLMVMVLAADRIMSTQIRSRAAVRRQVRIGRLVVSGVDRAATALVVGDILVDLVR